VASLSHEDISPSLVARSLRWRAPAFPPARRSRRLQGPHGARPIRRADRSGRIAAARAISRWSPIRHGRNERLGAHRSTRKISAGRALPACPSGIDLEISGRTPSRTSRRRRARRRPAHPEREALSSPDHGRGGRRRRPEPLRRGARSWEVADEKRRHGREAWPGRYVRYSVRRRKAAASPPSAHDGNQVGHRSIASAWSCVKSASSWPRRFCRGFDPPRMERAQLGVEVRRALFSSH